MIATDSIPSLVELSKPPARFPTVWGLNPVDLHDHFWAARGVFVVRMGEDRQIPRDAEQYLLTEPRTLAIFRLAPLIDTLSWVRPVVLVVRLINRAEEDYRETVLTSPTGKFLQFRRIYGMTVPRLSRVALTRSPQVAYAWQQSMDSRTAWRRLRHESQAARKETTTLTGRSYDRGQDSEVSQFVTDVIRSWNEPSATISELQRISSRVWAHPDAQVPSDVHFIGPVWVGAGRKIEPGATVVGPAVLWDDPSHRPQQKLVSWSELEPSAVLAAVRRNKASKARGPFGKRLFDILFALIVLLLTAPIYPLVMLAIWIEDGRPFFFAHMRETLGGREFPCLKFRSMRKDAERIKAALSKANQADGPQFYLTQDPRLTRIGRLIRKLNIDELPQFINVLRGDMSVVGPRPSPKSENQFNPAWREARLNVRAGITGLWQVCRTRRAGLDFQEWIKFDLQYVQNASWRLDLWIISKTIRVLLGIA